MNRCNTHTAARASKYEASRCSVCVCVMNITVSIASVCESDGTRGSSSGGIIVFVRMVCSMFERTPQVSICFASTTGCRRCFFNWISRVHESRLEAQTTNRANICFCRSAVCSVSVLSLFCAAIVDVAKSYGQFSLSLGKCVYVRRYQSRAAEH